MSAGDASATLFDERETATQLGVKRSTVVYERVRGRLGFVRVGARIFYTPDHIIEYLKNKEPD